MLIATLELFTISLLSFPESLSILRSLKKKKKSKGGKEEGGRKEARRKKEIREKGIKICKDIYVTLIIFRLHTAQSVNKFIFEEIKYGASQISLN